ncbi:hypothetical protein C0J52_23497, partial [Blattella germanica]
YTVNSVLALEHRTLSKNSHTGLINQSIELILLRMGWKTIFYLGLNFLNIFLYTRFFREFGPLEMWVYGIFFVGIFCYTSIGLANEHDVSERPRRREPIRKRSETQN